MVSIATALLSVMVFGAGDPPTTDRAKPPLRSASPSEVRVLGWLGERVKCNISGRLRHVPMNELLGGFRHRPGDQPWIGEHIGKWLHASAEAWQFSRDADLNDKMDRAAAELLATQKADGYLGTYEDPQRWTSWDVWVHKYDLIGLLAFHQATGNEAALAGARRIGDLMVATFGPGKRDIIASGTHVGMAATSILEPMVKLYRATGEEKYLGFCLYLVESWDSPRGPKVLASLLEHGKVKKTANGKAYEMMSNLVGLCELYRVTADARHLKAAQRAWEDINRNQTYVTGGVSLQEHFQPDGHLPDTGDIAETCANVTWMQLCLELADLTGEAKYLDPVEVLIYNHLLGAQAADGNDWCYFTPLLGQKNFRPEVNCCHSSGPRGVALIPGVIYGVGDRCLQVRLYAESRFQGELPGVGNIDVVQHTAYPAYGWIELEVRVGEPARFRLELRLPEWSKTHELSVNEKPEAVATKPGWIVLDRGWQRGDRVHLTFDAGPRWIEGAGEHAGKLAAARGPMILCASNRWNPELPPVWIAAATKDRAISEGADVPGADPGEVPFLAVAQIQLLTPSGVKEQNLVLGPYATVQQERFAVWLPPADQLSKLKLSLLYGGQEHYSRAGDVEGLIADGDPGSYRVTYNGKSAERDNWEIRVVQPIEISRVAFYHGHTAHNGGWFDTSGGKPFIEVATEKEGPFKPVGKLESYPATTADKSPEIPDGQAFEQTIAPVKVYGVRIVGKPAHGDEPNQTCSSCAELAAYE